jgi:hypothetical protein
VIETARLSGLGVEGYLVRVVGVVFGGCCPLARDFRLVSRWRTALPFSNLPALPAGDRLIARYGGSVPDWGVMRRRLMGGEVGSIE